MDVTNWLFFFVVVSLVSAGLLAVGLAVGYWRGNKHAKVIITPAQPSAVSDLDKLAGMGRAILGVQLRLDALCEIVYQQSTRIVDTRNFQLGLFEGDEYAVKVWIRSGERLTAQRFADHANDGLIGWVRKNAQGVRVGDYQRDWESLPAKPTYEAVDPPRSALFAPLIATGDVIGVIAVQSDEPDAFFRRGFASAERAGKSGVGRYPQCAAIRANARKRASTPPDQRGKPSNYRGAAHARFAASNCHVTA